MAQLTMSRPTGQQGERCSPEESPVGALERTDDGGGITEVEDCRYVNRESSTRHVVYVL